MSGSIGPSSDVIPQLPLALRYSPDQRLESYVQPPEGLLTQLRAMAGRSSPDWLFLVGPARTGKTHLALALCAQAEAEGHRAAYLPMQAAVGRMREALDALEGREVIALDGLEHVAGAREEEIAVFDFHNRARSAGACVLYTATAAPADLELALPDLRSRLGQCVRAPLQPLDDSGRRALLLERAHRRGLVLEEAAIDWLLAHTSRDLGDLVAVLEKLDRASLAAQRRVTVPFLRKVLGL